ncbi:hypothetical protein IH601_04840 [Candidatus Bipolaricaulota bacterium]|nr:hypothetical protein [Candidatus Bipolaricaulota bacterium]
MLLFAAVALAAQMETTSSPYLAAMPILEQGMSGVVMSMEISQVRLYLTRCVSRFVLVGAMASTGGGLDLSVRLLAPLELAPAFLALEMTPRRVTGLMTLFFGPVSIDLGRSWIDPARWAWLQLVVHPKLTLVAGGTLRGEKLNPQVGWRLFPTASSRWEIGVLFEQNIVKLLVGGVL